MSKRENELEAEYESEQAYSENDALSLVADEQPEIFISRDEACSVETQAQRTDKNESEGSATFTIVTRGKAPNRHNNKVQIKPTKFGQGMQVENWARNPVVLFEHGFGYHLPVGMGWKSEGSKPDLKMQASRASSKVYFHDKTEFAADVANMVFAGLVRMASIGFKIQKVMRLKQRAEAIPEGVEDVRQYYGGFDFVQTELTEWSITVIGADADALKQSVSARQTNGHKLSSRMLQYLSAAAGPITKQNQAGFAGWNALWTPETKRETSAFWIPDEESCEQAALQRAIEDNASQPAGSELNELLTADDVRGIIREEMNALREEMHSPGGLKKPVAIDTNSENGEVQSNLPEDFVTFEQMQSSLPNQTQTELSIQEASQQIANVIGEQLDGRFDQFEKRQDEIEKQFAAMTGKLPDE